jgi:EAL domain-containing protein (putative c-di-GMP-specific phosphodiesterase class I)
VRGRVCPSEFIGFAEKSGLIVPMGLWVVERAMADLARLQEARRKRSNGASSSTLFMSINVSGRQLLEGLDLDNLVERLSSGVVDPDTVKIELTESSLMDDPIEAASGLRRLKGVGVRVAIDDFGIGYSSLGYLQRFPLDTLKIDQSFVSVMMTEHASMKIVRAIASLAHDLDLDIVAEGVETEDQRVELIRLRCQYAQGYLFSRPLPFEEALAIAEAGACAPAAAIGSD